MAVDYYTVLLLTPDYLANEHGKDYLVFNPVVSREAERPKEEAVAQARKQIPKYFPDSDPMDWVMLALIMGRHQVMAGPYDNL